MCELCSKLITKTPKRRQWHIALVFSLLNLNKQISVGNVPLDTPLLLYHMVKNREDIDEVIIIRSYDFKKVGITLS